MNKNLYSILLLSALLIGCGRVSTTEDLPSMPDYDASHNEYQSKDNYLKEQSPATLDEEFIGSYIDVDDFGSETIFVQSNSSSVHSTFKTRDSKVSNAIRQNEYAYTFAKNNAINDISNIKEKNAENYDKENSKMKKELKGKEKEYEKFRDNTKENSEER